MINFVVVEDNKINNKCICDSIMSKMMGNKIEFKIRSFYDINDQLLNYVSNNRDDNIFILDLELPNGDGIDIARMIRNKYNNWISPIIIITAHSSKCFEVYKQRLQILDFIDKKDDIDKNLIENINIYLKMLDKSKVYRYVYRNVEYTIPFSQIDYIQRDGRKTKIVTKDNLYYQNLSVNEIKKYLPSNFVISTKGTLININNVKKIDWNNCLAYFKDGKYDYIVSKSHKKELINHE